MRRRAKGVFAKRMLSDNGVREADVARREATQDMSTAQRDVRLVLRENPPSRSLVLGSRLIYAPVLVRVCLVYVFGISGYAARQGRVLVLV